jgi:hypothetical protein
MNRASAASNGQQRRSYWLKTLHQWHWISSAICLIGILLFAITGITLNHAAQIESKPQVTIQTAQLDSGILALLQPAEGDQKSALPEAVSAAIAKLIDVRVGSRSAEWSDSEVYVSMPRAGGDAWLTIDRASGAVEYERTDRGWISYLNDLHKGRNTGTAWSWFIDLFAVACVVFSVTGFFLLQLHARQRPMTWPLVGFGLVVMLLIAILFIH